MSYGSPDKLDDVEAYYTDIRHGRKPSAEEVANLRERYQAIGGRSPLLDITRRQAEALELQLKSEKLDARVYVGMKHWHPNIAEAMHEITTNVPNGELIAIPLAPHYSRMSIGGYHHAVQKALSAYHLDLRLNFVESWHLHPELLRTWEELIETGLSEFQRKDEVYVLFTAHSLPEKIQQENAPYKQQLLETSSRLAERMKLGKWGFAFQSPGHTAESWLGPDILEKLSELKAAGETSVLAAPIGFVSDHLEILFDLDVEARKRSEQLGITFKRTRMPNDSPRFISTLTSLVRSRATTMARM
jgi:ferrochelatase